MFTFLNPLFLIGLFSAAIPLLIHLSRSRRTKKIRFSTTRFLTDQFLKSYRMSRLKELLLLATRMALCAFFAIALAQPLLLPEGQSFLVGQKRSVVFVVDNSASMGFREEGVTLLERARKTAKELLDGLTEEDTASIVLAGRRGSGPEVLFPEPTSQIGDVRQALDAVEVMSLGTDLTQAVAKAEEVLQSSAAKSKEIYVISDLQDSGWELPDAEASDEPVSDTLLFFVSVRPKQPQNLAVTAVQYAAARPMVGVPFSIRPHIRNHGDDVLACDAELYVDGKKVGERHVENLQGGRWAVPRFFHTFTSGGWHSGYVKIKDELLGTDNRRYFAFEVLDSIKVLAVNGAPSAVPRLDELFFLKAALTASAGGENPVAVDVVSPALLGEKSLAEYPLVILANVESLEPQAVEKLEAYVDRGGSVFFFLGDKTNPTFYNRSFAGANRLHGGLLPGRISEREGDPSAEKHTAFVGGTDPNHPALSAFSQGELGDLSNVTLQALWSIEPGEAMVLMRSNTGSPLLCEKPFGKGRVLLFASTCDRDWTNFPIQPAFLPWVYRLVGYLAQKPLTRRTFYSTGDSIPVPVSALEGIAQLLVRNPDGSIGHVATSNNQSTPFAYDDTVQIGAYKMFPPGKENEAQIFVANLDAYESDLTFLDDVLFDRKTDDKFPSRSHKIEAGIKELLPGHANVSFIENPARATEVSLNARRGVKLWDLVLMAALLIALFEPWFANRISLKHYLKPRDVPQVPLMPTGRLRPSRSLEPTVAEREATQVQSASETREVGVG